MGWREGQKEEETHTKDRSANQRRMTIDNEQERQRHPNSAVNGSGSSSKPELTFWDDLLLLVSPGLGLRELDLVGCFA